MILTMKVDDIQFEIKPDGIIQQDYEFSIRRDKADVVDNVDIILTYKQIACLIQVLKLNNEYN